MRTQTLAGAHNQLLVQRNIFFFVSCASLLLNLILSALMFHFIGKQRVVVTPPTLNTQFWIANDMVSDSYLEQMSGFFTSLLLNVSPASFQARSQQLLQHVNPKDYALIKAQLVEQQAEIERRGISTSFHPVYFKVDKDKLVVEIHGELRVMIGGSPIELKSSVYQMQYTLNHGRLYIKKFQEVSYEK